MSNTGNQSNLPLHDAAAYLSLPEAAVRALVAARFLATAGDAPDGPQFRLGDLKGFLARNADYGSGNVLDVEPVEPAALLEALAGRAGDMARRSFDIFATLLPEARAWPRAEQARFVEQARGRFEAVLAVTGRGAPVDETLVQELEEVGAEAAREDAPLPPLLLTLRISRDLLVRTAVELAETGGRRWGPALSLVLPRLPPAVDRLTDALVQGYWTAVLAREQARAAMFEHAVDGASEGVYEIDLEGRIRYANPALAAVLGRRPDQLAGSLLADLFTPLDHALSLDELARPGDAVPLAVELPVVRHDGERQVLEIRTLRRMVGGRLTGFQGIVRDVTARHDLDAGRNELLAAMASGLRRPLEAVRELATALGEGATDAQAASIHRTAASLVAEAARVTRLLDDLADLERLEAGTLELHAEPVDLASVLRSAITSVPGAGEVASVPGAGEIASVSGAGKIEMRVPPGVSVQVDVRRFGQVVARIVENALRHARPPVVVELVADDGREVEVAVTDAGAGVPPALEPTLFTLVRTGRSTGGTGTGLALAKRLVEAMGGRVSYRRAAGGGASFRVAVPAAHRRPAHAAT